MLSIYVNAYFFINVSKLLYSFFNKVFYSNIYEVELTFCESFYDISGKYTEAIE